MNKPVSQPVVATELLHIAKSILLEPSGLTEADLQQTFGVLFSHQLDDADLYFQRTHNESWSLEEGIVKSGSFSIDQGVGVRAIHGDKTAFAYSDEINLAALTKSAKATRVIGPQGGTLALAKTYGHAALPALYANLNP